MLRIVFWASIIFKIATSQKPQGTTAADTNKKLSITVCRQPDIPKNTASELPSALCLWEISLIGMSHAFSERPAGCSRLIYESLI